MATKKLTVIVFLTLMSLLFAQDDEATIKSLIEDLGSNSFEAREKATDELIELGDKAKELVQEAFNKSQDLEVKSRCELILKIIPLRQGVGEEFWEKASIKLKVFAATEDVLERLMILKEFKEERKISDDKLASLAEIIANDISKIVRRGDKFSIITFIQVNNLKFASKIVVKFLEDKDRDVRRGAVDALGAIGAKEHAMAITRVLEDQDAGVRMNAIHALCCIEAKEYVKVIARLLEDQDAGVRCNATISLGKLGAKEYVKDIARLLEDQVDFVCAAATISLGKLGAKEYAKDIARLLEDQDACVRGQTAFSLGQLGAQEYAKDIEKLIKDLDANVHIFAMAALVKFGEDKYLEDIIRLLEDQDVLVRGDAARALEEVGTKETIEALKKAFEKEDINWARQLIMDAIIKLEDQNNR